ncbi:MAG TPA: GTPase Era [Bryobacteraceae bacterium]|nr:GTPase Era [Bryobacteraceae bacterium]
MSKSPDFVSGFVSILGRPSAGKSTLLNALVGAKLSIVAAQPQTTRTVIQGVLTAPGAQVVFLDTPGIHRSDTLFNRRMMVEVRTALEDRDLLLYVVDAARPFQTEDSQVLDMIKKAETSTFLVLNKIDRVNEKAQLLPLIEEYRKHVDFEEYLPVSALKAVGLDELRTAILNKLPVGPPFFPADHITDQPERFMAAELIREKILRETRQEVPHSVAVVIENWEEKKSLLRISAAIYVEREGQKAIIIGSKGAMLKKVGTLARQEMEVLFDRKIFLQLFVKVRSNWRESPEFLNELDWRTIMGGNSE